MSENDELITLLTDLKTFAETPAMDNSKKLEELISKFVFLIYTEGIHIHNLEIEVAQLKEQLSKK